MISRSNHLGCDDKLKEGRRFVALLFSIAIIQIAVYYLSAALVNGPGPLAVPQPDTLLYCQAARRICEGHAFSFSTGTAVSTGTTSVLYPFVLAVPYAMGFDGLRLISAGFIVNACFYLLFILSWFGTFRQWFSERTANYAGLLLVLFPQTVYCALAQSDTGFWMAVSAVFIYGLATERRIVWIPLLLIGPWVRPEGVIFVFTIAFLGVLRKDKGLLYPAVFGLLSTVGVFALNAALTGNFIFSSVANKGYFKVYPFADAIGLAAFDALTSFRDIVLGMKTETHRCYYFMPVLGTVSLIYGLFVRDWKWSRDWVIAFCALSVAAGMAIVAQSGWQGSNMDRYFAWMMPLLVAFSATGLLSLAKALSRYSSARVLTSIPILFDVCVGIYLVCAFHRCCAATDLSVRFGQEINRAIPDSASVGGISGSGTAYLLGDRRVANLSGIYSPEFACKESSGVFEILKNEPSTRFDYFLLAPEDSLSRSINDLWPKCAVMGPDGCELRRTNWTAFDRATNVTPHVGWKLCDRVDVCYEKDEARADYQVVLRYGVRPYSPILQVRKVQSGICIDFGRLVIGYDEFTVHNLEKGRDAFVVMRTSSSASAKRDTALESVKLACTFEQELDLHVSVNGKPVACCHGELEPDGFSNVVLRVPGSAIDSNVARIGLHGDHLAFCYWIYQ